jgi:hypothetical protein
MKSKLLLLFSGLIIFWITPSYAQIDTTKNFDSLLCKEWMLQSIEENGQKIPIADDERNAVLVFNFDHTILSLDTTSNWQGIWEYEKPTKTITIIDNDDRTKDYLTIVKLNSHDCIFLFKDTSEGTSVRIFMTAKPK